jgi:tetratricopeptide (TPR) repeat protein
MLESIATSIVAAWTAAVGTIVAFTFADWIKIALAIVGGVYGIYQAYLHAERRIHRLLDRYFSREQQKLSGARSSILRAIERAHKTHPVVEPIFSNRELRLAVRSLRLGRHDKASTHLKKIGSLAEARRANIEKYRRLHTAQTATSHLFLGAIAASKSDHGGALKHFQDALQVDPNDLEAMEYAGQQYLKLGHPEAALQHFLRMRDQAQQTQDPRQEMRALRHCGLAYQSFALPQWAESRRVLLQAEKLVPKVLDPLDAAFTLEWLGRVRKQLKGYRRAKDSFADALVRYSASTEAEAAEGAARVRKEIGEINALQTTEADLNDEPDSTSNNQQ